MESLPWPAEAFLSDAAVKLALANQKHAEIAFLILFASQSWLEDSGMLPTDEPRLGAILGLDAGYVHQAKAYWMSEGKIEEKGDRLYLPWLTRAKAAKEAGAQARSDQAKGAAAVRWGTPTPKKGENLSLPPASGEHADSKEWPKEYTKIACDVWISRWGSGSAPGDVIGMNLKQLKKGGASWEEVIRSFQRYVETAEDQYASPAAWRKRWRAYDPEVPEYDHEAAKIADSIDRQRRQRGVGFRPAAKGLLPDGED